MGKLTVMEGTPKASLPPSLKHLILPHTGYNTPTVSFGYRLKVLFYIATTNFVVPALFSLIQIITLYRETDQEVTNDIVLVNTNISVILVVFASIWAGSWARSEEIADGLPFHGHAPHGAATHTTTGNRSMHFAVRSLAARSTTGTGGTVDLSSTRGVPSDANASVPMFISAEKTGGEKLDIGELECTSCPWAELTAYDRGGHCILNAWHSSLARLA